VKWRGVANTDQGEDEGPRALTPCLLDADREECVEPRTRPSTSTGWGPMPFLLDANREDDDEPVPHHRPVQVGTPYPASSTPTKKRLGTLYPTWPPRPRRRPRRCWDAVPDQEQYRVGTPYPSGHQEEGKGAVPDHQQVQSGEPLPHRLHVDQEEDQEPVPYRSSTVRGPCTPAPQRQPRRG